MGRRCLRAWIVGVYLAFMPLYILGFMGMPRRLAALLCRRLAAVSHRCEFGALFILCGITLLAIQLAVTASATAPRLQSRPA